MFTLSSASMARRAWTLADLETGVVVHHGSRIRRVKSKRWFDLAGLVLPEVLGRAEEDPPPGRSTELIEAVAAERFESVVEDDVRQVLIYLAYFGYLCREVEEGWKWTETGSRWIRHVLATGSEVAGTKTDTFEELVSWVAVHACDRTKADQPPGFCIDAIDDPLWAVRDPLMVIFCQIQSEVCEHQKLCEPDRLPQGTEVADFMAAWRIGVLIRACEMSALLPR